MEDLKSYPSEGATKIRFGVKLLLKISQPDRGRLSRCVQACAEEIDGTFGQAPGLLLLQGSSSF